MNFVTLIFLDWKTTTNKRVIESSFSAETQAALMAHGQAHFIQCLSIEVEHGKQTMIQADEKTQQRLQPLCMVTDCKSLYDTVRKQGQHVTDKGAIVSIVLIRQLCETTSTGDRARLLWVPTEYQLADGLTKSGKSEDFRRGLEAVKLHETALCRGQQLKTKGTHNSQKRSYTNVKDGGVHLTDMCS